MALGASMGRVQADVLRNTMRLAAIGIVMGTAASLVLTRLIATLLYNTSPWDGTTYVGMAVVLVTVALASGYLPARRASRIDPMAALRTD
jgi:ABC-type antimicrobial peptide transport system permease subunit